MSVETIIILGSAAVHPSTPSTDSAVSVTPTRPPSGIVYTLPGSSPSGAWFPLSVDALWAAPTHELRRDTTIWFNPSFYGTDLIGALIRLAH